MPIFIFILQNAVKLRKIIDAKLMIIIYKRKGDSITTPYRKKKKTNE